MLSRRELMEIRKHMQRCRETATDGVLAVVTSTSGSTFRKAGCKLFFDARENFTGTLGGACFDLELLESAHTCLQRQIVCFRNFDLTDESEALLGYNLGCQGQLHLMLIPVPWNADEEFKSLLLGDSIREPQTVSFWLQNNGNIVLEAANPEDLDILTTSDTGKKLIYSETRSWPRRLFLVGSNIDALTLHDHARSFGWPVFMIDDRPHKPMPTHSAQWIREASPTKALKKVPPEPNDAWIIMSHNFMTDAEWLLNLEKLNIAYTGLLGPSKRRQKLFAYLGWEDLRFPNLHSPIGRKIKAYHPDGLALSILATLEETLAERGIIQ